MELYPFLSTVFVRRVSARTNSSVAALTLLALTFCVAGLVAVSCLDPPARAAQQEEVKHGDIPPDIDVRKECRIKREAAPSLGQAREDPVAGLQAAASRVTSRDLRALARALGFRPDEMEGKMWTSKSAELMEEDDLDGDGIPEAILNGLAPVEAASAVEERQLSSGWRLALLSWDGAKWRASPILERTGAFQMTVIYLEAPSRGIAIIPKGEQGAIPCPLVFRVRDHAARLAWDACSDESRYVGYAGGQVEFLIRTDGSSGPITTILEVTGRADPGLLVFPRTGRRGFEVKTVYVWGADGFVPSTTHYSENEDYILYRFISALHLRDFRSAYALIDPAKFLKTQEPSLEAFRKQIEGTWPEFLDDHIFEARDGGQTAPDDFSFELKLEDKVYTYHPAFSPDTKHLLTSLERREGR